jgi:chemotaxis protein MotB
MKTQLAIVMVLMVSMLSGCAFIQKAQRADGLEIENTNLRNRIAQLQKKKDMEISELEQAQRELEESLKKEIGNYKAKLEMTERGLVITFVSEIFFDSGKDSVKQTGKATLGKVAEVLNRDVPNSKVAVEGHTDNDPIKYSGWKSNWELSSARALAVLHYLISEGKVKPRRLSANGYGEFHPVAPNDTAQNKQKNRRVEIVILPSKLSKVKP